MKPVLTKSLVVAMTGHICCSDDLIGVQSSMDVTSVYLIRPWIFTEIAINRFGQFRHPHSREILLSQPFK